jgi:tetratricopeptide (TPR) repeat protein
MIRVGNSPLQKVITTVVLAFAMTMVVSVSFAQKAPRWKVWASRADTLYQQEQFPAAIKALTKAIKLSKLQEKESFVLIYRRAVCYYSVGQYNLSLKDLDTFVQKAPGATQAVLLRALIYRELGNNDKQLEYLSEAIATRAPRAELFRWRGLVYLQMDHYPEAKADLLAARQMDDDAETETYLGLAYYNLHQTDSALIAFNRSIEFDATYLPAFLYAGSAAMESGDIKLGLQYLNLALKLDPSNKEALYYKGAALVEMEKTEEGCRCLNRAFYLGMDDAADYLKEYCFDWER